MTTLREAAQQALEALEAIFGWQADQGQHRDAITALRTALAESENGPVAWMYDFLNPDNREEIVRNWTTQNYADISKESGFNVRPLYTHPLGEKK
jgi:hypothetical protein